MVSKQSRFPKTVVGVKAHDELIILLKERLRGNTDGCKAFDRLMRALLPLRDAKTGKIAGDNAYLRTALGKRVLRNLIKVGFPIFISWPESEALLGRAKSTIESALSYHQLRRAHPKYLSWTTKRIEVVKRRFAESKTIRSKEKLKAHRDETIAEINALPGQTVSWNAIHCFTRDQEPALEWGMTPDEKKQHDIAIIKGVCNDKTLSLDEKRTKLCAKLGLSRHSTVLQRLIQCGFLDEAEQLKLQPGYKSGAAPAQTILERDIKQHLTERVAAGDLVNPDVGVNVLYRRTRDEFAERLSTSPEVAFSKADFPAILDEVVKTPERWRHIRQSVRAGLTPEEYHEDDWAVTIEMVRRWFSEVRGVTTKIHPPTFLRDLAVFDPTEQKNILTLPEGSYDNPVDIGAAALDSGIEIMNGIEFGTIYNPDMEDNLFRRALANAEERGVHTIILTNVMDIHVKKTASSNMIPLAAISGHEIDDEAINLLDPNYQEAAREALAEIRRDPNTDRMIYVKPIDRVKLSFRGIYKVANTTDLKTKKRRPEFSGQVLVILSHMDEAIVDALAGARAAENAQSEHGRVLVKLRLAETELERMLTSETVSEDQIEIQEARIARLCAEKEYTRVSYSAKNNSDRYAAQMLSLLIRGYKAAIPNCTVIGKGTTVVKAGDRTIEVHIPGDEMVSEAALSKYAGNYGPKVLRRKLADAVVVCPKYSLNYRMVGREHTGEGRRRSTPVVTAPMLIDDAYLRGKTSDIIRTSAHKLLRVLRSEITCSGILRLDFDGEDKEIVSPSTFPVSSVFELPKLKLVLPGGKAPAYLRARSFGEEPFFCAVIDTDPHRGGRAREVIWCPKRRMYLGCHEAMIDLMIRGGLYTDPQFPVPTFFFMCDDIVQGLHFPAYSQTHPHLISQGDMEKLWAEEIERTKSSRDRGRYEALMEAMHKELSYQRRIQGTDWVENQLLEASTEMLDPYARFYHLIVENAVDSGVELLGMSHYELERRDSRDLGFINFTIAGNHHERTVQGHVAEGNRMTRETRLLLRSMPDIDRWRKHPDVLDMAIRSPNFSGEFIGGATACLPGGKPWGLMGRSSPTSLSSWADPLGAAVRKELGRGDHLGFQRFVESTLLFVGDKHFDASNETLWLKAEMGPAGAHTDRYGQRGFPPNNTGIKFVLFPVGGPGRGPILRRTLMSWNLRHYIEEKPDAFFDWKKFLPNVIRAT